MDLRDGVDLGVLGARLLNVPLLIDHSGRLPQGRAGRVVHLMPLYVSRETLAKSSALAFDACPWAPPRPAGLAKATPNAAGIIRETTLDSLPIRCASV